jgi:hypothetical protein
VTVPFAQAEQTISRLNAIRHGDRPLASLAGDRKDEGASRHSDRNGASRHSDMNEASEYARQRRVKERGERPARKERDDDHRAPWQEKPAYDKKRATPSAKPKSAATGKPRRSASEVAEPVRATTFDDAPVTSSGGFDWAAFEASLPDNWDKEGGKKGKRGAATPRQTRQPAAAPARPGHAPKGTVKRTAAKAPKTGKMTAKIRSKR